MKHTMLRRLFSGLAAAVMIFALTGCGSKNYASSGPAIKPDGGSYETPGYNPEDSYSKPQGNGSMVEIPDSGDRKIVYTAYVSLETENLETALEQLKADVAAAGGYIEDSQYYASSYRLEQQLAVRVPVETYGDFLAGSSRYGTISRQTESSDDITSYYVDVEARIKALEQQRDRMQELLAEAESIETVLYIEKELSYTQYELESYISQLNSMKGQISYCTINYDIEQPLNTVISAAPYGQKLSRAFVEGIESFVDFLQDLGLFLVGNVLQLLLLIAVICLAVALIRRGGARSRAKAQAAAAARRAAGASADPAPKYTPTGTPKTPEE